MWSTTVSPATPPFLDTNSHSTTAQPESDSCVETTLPEVEERSPSTMDNEMRGLGATPVPPRSKIQTILLMFALCMCIFLAALDITIVTTALPTISEQFHSTAAYTWIGSAFLLATAASTPTWGKLSDIWGRKPLLLAAVAVFIVGSALCGAATNIEILIGGRALQGLGAGGLLTLVNIVIGDIFSQRDRATYYGIIGMVWATASATGPVIGGVLTDKVSWRWCFYLNLPISGSVFAIILFTLKLQTPKTPIVAGLMAIDWLGSLAITGATLMFLLGLQFGGVTHPWASAAVLCLIIFGLLTVIIFSLIEWKVAKYPIIPTHLLTSTSNIASLVVVFLHGLIFISGSYFLPLYFQSVLGATPILSGIWLLPFALSLSFSSAATGVYIKITGRYIDCIRFGFVMATLGFGLFYILPEHRVWAKIIIFQILAGIGAGPNFQSPLLALQSNVSAQDNGTVTTLFGFVRDVATSVGVVIGGVIFNNKMKKQQEPLVNALGPRLGALLSGGSAGANVFLVDRLPEAQKLIARHAFYVSIREIWIGVVCFAAVGLVVCLFIKRNTLNKQHENVRTGLEAEEERRKRVGKTRKKTRGVGHDGKRDLESDSENLGV